MAFKARYIGSLIAVLAVFLVAGCGPKQEAKQPKKASSGLDLDFLGESGSDSSVDAASGDVEEPYSPCAQKQCGDTCNLCDPVDESCVQINLLHQCTAKGECVLAPAKCGG